MDNMKLPEVFTLTSWLLQNLIYFPTRFFLQFLKKYEITCSPDLTRVGHSVVFAVAPHSSHMDVVVVPAAIPRRLLPVRWLADDKIFTSRSKGLWLKLWGAIPVTRDPEGGFTQVDVNRVLSYLEAGKNLGVFPECCLVGGHFNNRHIDVIGAALNKGFPVVPVALSGLSNPAPSEQKKDTSKSIQVIASRPITDYADLLDALAS